ncbi:hypothetical protein PPYR_04255 [Photinus pyralis]|uniref:Transposase domain-containing protein n=1 Tax=Photinus pyralis TaxID=7054 RepID=A0A5N4AXK3_PHOPY|nr:hypothetical protein PPYR_04255 [Photinus pyralis]
MVCHYSKALLKPKSFSLFLKDFVDEAVDLCSNGLLFNNEHFTVEIIGFVCDAPAKSEVLGIKGHGGYSYCTKCSVRGITSTHKRVFLETDCPIRTHEDFINWADSSYRLNDTPLVQIPQLHFVNSIVLDYMHLVCLGVMRTMLNTWCNGDLPHKLSYNNISIVSEHLLVLSKSTPCEFARKPRDLKLIHRFKATEFRMFLLYFGPIVLKDILNSDKYNNFLTLHVAISISCSKCSPANTHIHYT